MQGGTIKKNEKKIDSPQKSSILLFMKLNKDGTPRKKGSGRPKGSGSFSVFTLKQLSEQLPAGARIVVSRVWADNLNLVGSDVDTVNAQPKTQDATVVVGEPLPQIAIQEIDLNDL